jgi:hypothetical protein
MACILSPAWNESRSTREYSPTWDDVSQMTYKCPSPTWNDANQMTYKRSPTWDDASRMTYKCSPAWDESRMTCKCSPTWDETCILMYYEKSNLKSILSKYNKFMDEICNLIYYEKSILRCILSQYDKSIACKIFQEWGRTPCAMYYETKSFELDLLPNINFMTCNRSQTLYKNCKFRNKTPLHQCFHHFRSCSLFLTAFERKHLEYSSHRNLMRKHVYAVYWLEQYLIYISALIIYGYCILTGRRNKVKTEKNENEKKKH